MMGLAVIAIVVIAGMFIFANNSTSGSIDGGGGFWGGGGGGYSPSNPPVIDSSYSAILDIVPEVICVGDSTMGSVMTNLPAGSHCAIFVNAGAGWQFVYTANLDANGDARESRVMNTAGVLTLEALCYDHDGNGKISNTHMLVVNVCDGGGSGGDEGSDEGGGALVCNANVPPFSDSACAARVCSSGTCKYYPAEAAITAHCGCATCSDTDGGNNVNVVGTCNDGRTSITDNCQDTTYVNENWCSSDTGTCMGASMVCPRGTYCLAGRCNWR